MCSNEQVYPYDGRDFLWIQNENLNFSTTKMAAVLISTRNAWRLTHILSVLRIWLVVKFRTVFRIPVGDKEVQQFNNKTMELYRVNSLGGTFQPGRAVPSHVRNRITELFTEFSNFSRNENSYFNYKTYNCTVRKHRFIFAKQVFWTEA